MAAKYSLLPLLRRISKPYMSIHKFPVIASSQSRLDHAWKALMQSILNPGLGGLQRTSVIGLLQSGYPASNYARGCKPVSKDEDDRSEYFWDDVDKTNKNMDFDEDEVDSDDASDEE